MKLTFLGTRGEIDSRTRRHRRHTSTLVSYRGRDVMIDCGEDWLGHIGDVRPRAIVVTHGHPDHAWGLAEGAPCPVYGPPAVWETIGDYPIDDARRIEHRRPVEIEGIGFEAFPVVHSMRRPAFGYRITAGRVAVFYVPDVVYIEDRGEALRGVKAYIGDGASPRQSMVRRKGDRLMGHTPVRTQLTWCRKEGVPRMIVTHCGSQIVDADERTVLADLRSMGRERGVEVELAHDGMEVVLR